MSNSEKDAPAIARFGRASILAAAVALLVSAAGAEALSFNIYLGRDITGSERELSRYDLLVLSPRVLREPAALREIRERNPDIRLYMIFDLLSGNDGDVNFLSEGFSEGILPEWKMRSTTGDILSTWPETFLCNVTEHCPAVGGMRFRDYAVKYLEKTVLPLMGEFDGLFLDECIESILWIDGSFGGDFDLNNDRVADHPDSVHVWVARGWRALLDDIRERHPELPIVGNGNNHFYGRLDGRMFEDFPNSSYGDLIGGMAQLETWRMNREDPVCLLNATAEPEDERARRASWALAQYAGQYLGFDGGPWDHSQLQWSGLFDLALGRAREPFRVEGERLLRRDYDSPGPLSGLYPQTTGRWVEGEEALVGEGSLELDSPGEGWRPLVSMDLEAWGGREVIASFRYHVLEAPRDGVRLYQAFRGRGGDGGEKVSLPTRIVHEGEYGYVLAKGSRALENRGDYYFYLASSEGCRLVIDEIEILSQRSAHLRRTFGRGVLVHSLSPVAMELDPEGEFRPDPDHAFAGSWYESDRGQLMLRPGETLLLIPELEAGGDNASQDGLGDSSGSGGAAAVESGGPAAGFMAAFPNPFNPRVHIPFSLERDGRVRAAVYDAAGRRVRELADRVFSAGEHRLEWGGENERGGRVGSGVYFLRLEGGGRRSVQKLVLAG